MDEVSDSDGKSYGWPPRARMADLVHKGALRLVVEMFSVNTVSEGRKGPVGRISKKNGR